MTCSTSPAGEGAPSSAPSPAGCCAHQASQAPHRTGGQGTLFRRLLPGQARRRPPTPWHRWLARGAVLLVVMLTVGAGTDLAVLAARPQRVAVTMPAAATSPTASTSPSVPGSAETWLVVGVDSRDTVPQGPDHYGSTQEVPGSRADVVALVQPRQDKVTALTLPRDLVLLGASGSMDRLATSYLSGPQGTVDLLCHALGVTTSHLVVVDMSQFAAIIDSLGGLEVDLPEPVRDPYSGLSLPTAGPQRLSGTEALALVRSRHPEVLREGSWSALDEAEGKQRRATVTSAVMSGVLEEVTSQASSPWSTHQLAHQLASQVTLDEATGVTDMLRLARSVTSARTRAAEGADSTSQGLDVIEVPAADPGSDQGAGGGEALGTEAQGGDAQSGDTAGSGAAQAATITTFPDEETYAVLAEHGYAPGSCSVAPG